MSQADRKRVAKMGRSFEALMSEFGTDKKRQEFTLEVERSLDRYLRKQRDNLFAIVMPSGSGKTTMCDRYGFVDIDRCCTYNEHQLLNSMRIRAVNGEMSWDEHNEYWLKLVDRTLDMLDYSRPVVIMLHSEVLALALGALPLAGFCPSTELFKHVYKQKEEAGNKAGAMLSALNREEFLSHSNVLMKTKRTYASFEQMEALILRTMNVNGLPVATPMKCSSAVWNDEYSRSCPDWVLTGRGKPDMRELLALYRAGCVPKECMDFFCKRDVIPASFGFGMRMNEWSAFMANVRSRVTDRKDWDPHGDMAKQFPYIYEKMMTRSNITMQRIASGTDILLDRDVEEIVSHHVGKPNNFVSALVCYWEGIGKKLRSRELVKMMLGVSYVYWGDTFKEFHSLIRMSKFFMNTEVTEEERQNLMYLDLFLGKEDEEADWKQEVEDRLAEDSFPEHKAYDPNISAWTRSQYWRDFTKALDSGYHRMSEKMDVDVTSFADFYERRATWLTKGSMVQNKLSPDMKKYTMGIVDEVGELVSEVVRRHNKKSLFEVLDAIKEMDQGFELFNLTKMVTKLDECGHKKRALFPGSFLHYIVVAYVMYAAERQGQVGNVRLNAPPDDDIAYFEMKMEDGIPRLMFDWMNFNAFHSMDEMSLVIEKLGSVVPAGSDYKEFCALVADSTYNMKMLDPEGTIHDLNKGLYSGWRHTSWDNNVLNNGYVASAVMSFERLFGHEPFRMIDGGGDDLDTQTSRHDDTYLMLGVMQKMQMKGKPIKQMIDTKSEFFRNTIGVHGVYASANRALAMFVNGKWEGSGAVPIEHRISAILDQIAKIVRRGMDPAFGDLMAVLCLSHWCKIRTGEDWLSMPAAVLHGRLEDNGLGIPDSGGKVWVLSEEVPRAKLVKEAGEPPGKLASTDFLAILCRELRSMSIDVVRQSDIAAKMAKMSFEVYEEYDYSEVFGYGGKCIERVDAVTPLEDEAIWESFVDYVAIKTVDREMNKLLRYQELVPYMEVNGKPLSTEKFAEICGMTINTDVLDFKGNVYYRRIVSEPIGRLITDFCTVGVARHGVDLRLAEHMFKVLCWMSSKRLDFHM